MSLEDICSFKCLLLDLVVDPLNCNKSSSSYSYIGLRDSPL